MSAREQGFCGAEQGLAPALLGRLGQGGQHQLRGCVHVFELLRQLLHHKLEAEPTHLRTTQRTEGSSIWTFMTEYAHL